MCHKKTLVILLLCFGMPLVSQTAIATLVQETSRDILNLLQAPKPVLAVVDFKDNSYLSDLEAQTVYQLLAMNLEQSGRVVFRDLMVDFSSGRGHFNYSKSEGVRYSLYLVILDTADGIALAASVRLVESAELVGLVYRKARINPEVFWAVSQTVNPSASAAMILSSQESYRIDNSIFSVFQDLTKEDGGLYALSPDFLLVWRNLMPNQGPAEKMPLTWPYPRTPSIENEGKINSFTVAGQAYLALGSNFSSHSLIVPLGRAERKILTTLPFIPFLTAVMGEAQYLIGGRYIPGTNSFDGVLHFLSLESWNPDTDSTVSTAQKRMDPFYDLTVSLGEDRRLNAVYSVGDAYSLSMRDSEWNPLIPQQTAPISGASMTALEGKWLLTSGTEVEGDSLILYDIEDSGLRHIGSVRVQGRIHSLTQGKINGQSGVWLIRHERDSTGRKLTWLDFWRVSHEEK